MASDSKYVVFHRDYYEQWMNEWPEVNPAEEPLPIDDAVVIRLQDVFAAPALYAYAASIRTAIEIMERARAATGTPRAELDGIVDRLNDIADYFMEQAVKAERSEKMKIPD